jgi:hypothetical protein
MLLEISKRIFYLYCIFLFFFYSIFFSFRLEYLPFSLTQINISAIWLSENQATGKLKLQTDFDQKTNKDILTCYLLPQQNFQANSLGNSINSRFFKKLLIICLIRRLTFLSKIKKYRIIRSFQILKRFDLNS